VKKIALLFFLLSFIAFSSLVGAAGVEMTTDTNELTISSGQMTSVFVTVKNTQSDSDVFSITVWPNYWNGASATPEQTRLDINSNQEASFRVYFNVPSCTEEFSQVFKIGVSSATKANVNDSKDVNLIIKSIGSVCVSDVFPEVSAYNPGDYVTITTKVTNIGQEYSEQLNVQTDVTFDNNVIKRFDNTTIVAKQSTETVKNSFNIGKYAAPGTYYIESTLKDVYNRKVNSAKATFYVNNKTDQPTIKKTVTYGILSSKTVITVKNDNNVVLPDFYVMENIPDYTKPFFYPATKSTDEKTVGTNVIYFWIVSGLKPGEERVVSYEFKVHNVIALAVVLIAGVFFIFFYVYKLEIIKHYKHIGSGADKETVVSLDVRNGSSKEMRDVYVRDFVPSIAKVMERFGTLKPTVRKSEGGTELIWKIDSLRPKEERVITYHIKPVLDVRGVMKLPHASASYYDKSKKRHVAASKSIAVRLH